MTSRFGITHRGRFRPFPKWLSHCLRRYGLWPLSLWYRGMTLGAQVAAFNGRGEILLVRQGYTQDWQFPGGGVDRGEDIATAAARELREEAAASPVNPLRFFAVYTNFTVLPGDHVGLFVADRVRCDAFPEPNLEIVAHGFFPVDNLPDPVHKSVPKRLAEINGERCPDTTW